MRLESMTNNPKRILLTGGRSTITLDIARSFHSAGHTVYVADSHKMHICRFSNAVKKNFWIRSPRFHTEEFIDDLNKIIEEHHIDMLIPTCEETIYVSYGLDKFPESCEVFCEPFCQLNTLHSKWLFMQQLKELGFEIPETTLIQSKEDLENLRLPYSYALKATYSRACQHIMKVESGSLPPDIHIDSYNPWIAQKWIEGKKYCTYSIAKKGKIYAHSIYPVGFTLEGSSCITFEAVRHPKILEWVKQFAEKTKFTGHLAFDFIETDEGKLYSIECNPRATHGLHLFSDDDDIYQAFFGENTELKQPKEGTIKQIALGMMAFGWRSVNRNPYLPKFLDKFFAATDVVYSKHDLKPFFLMGLLFPMYWYMGKKANLSIPAVFTHDIEWNGERIQMEEHHAACCPPKKELNMV